VGLAIVDFYASAAGSSVILINSQPLPANGAGLINRKAMGAPTGHMFSTNRIGPVLRKKNDEVMPMGGE